MPTIGASWWPSGAAVPCRYRAAPPPVDRAFYGFSGIPRRMHQRNAPMRASHDEYGPYGDLVGPAESSAASARGVDLTPSQKAAIEQSLDVLRADMDVLKGLVAASEEEMTMAEGDGEGVREELVALHAWPESDRPGDADSRSALAPDGPQGAADAAPAWPGTPDQAIEDRISAAAFPFGGAEGAVPVAAPVTPAAAAAAAKAAKKAKSPVKAEWKAIMRWSNLLRCAIWGEVEG